MIAKLLCLACVAALVQARPPATSEVLPNGCPANWKVYRYLPHENDSAHFYHCVRGERYLIQCPPGTNFKENLQTCYSINGGGSGNSGQNNSGSGNTGNNNSGRGNGGNNNSGNGNGGDFNTGNGNTGKYNTGNGNSGDNNIGDHNGGNNHIGSYNA